MDEVKIHCKNIDAATAVRRLRAIHDDVQGKFHDQWDWMGADFCVEVLATLLTASEAQVAALTEQVRVLSAPIATVQETCVGPDLLVCDIEAEMWFGIANNPKAYKLADQINAAFSTRSAAPGKEVKDGN